MGLERSIYRMRASRKNAMRMLWQKKRRDAMQNNPSQKRLVNNQSQKQKNAYARRFFVLYEARWSRERLKLILRFEHIIVKLY